MNARLFVIVGLCTSLLLTGCMRKPPVSNYTPETQPERANRYAAQHVLTLDWQVQKHEPRTSPTYNGGKPYMLLFYIYSPSRDVAIGLNVDQDHRFFQEFVDLSVGEPVTFVHLPYQGGGSTDAGAYLAPHCTSVDAYCKKIDLSGY